DAPARYGLTRTRGAHDELGARVGLPVDAMLVIFGKERVDNVFDRTVCAEQQLTQHVTNCRAQQQVSSIHEIGSAICSPALGESGVRETRGPHAVATTAA